MWKKSKGVLKYSSTIKKTGCKGNGTLNFVLNLSESRSLRIADLFKNVIFSKRKDWHKRRSK